VAYKEEEQHGEGYLDRGSSFHNDEGTSPRRGQPAILHKFGGRYVVAWGRFNGVNAKARSRQRVIEFRRL